jgi:hypothetical protein
MTHQDLLQLLTNRIPPPEQPDRIEGTTLNNALGPSIALPDDYRLFLDVYGPGWFTEPCQNAPLGQYPALWVFDLVSANPHQNIGGSSKMNPVEMLMRTAAELHDWYPDFPDRSPPAYPAVPGVLPWGEFDQGYVFYWWVDGPPNSWRVCVDDRSWINHYDYSLLEFLVVNLTGRAGDKFFDDGEERFSGFLPLSKYREFQQSYFRGEKA